MRLADATGIRIGGKDAIEAKLNGHVVWSAQPVITLTSPQEGASYQAGDSVPLSVSIERFDTDSVDYIIERV